MRGFWGVHTKNVTIVNNTASDIRPFEAEIVEALRSTGTLPEELADTFTVVRLDNPDGSPRWCISCFEDR